MDNTLLNFIAHLRHHGVPVSTAETLDAMQVAAALGYQDPELLKDGLGSCLAKSQDNKTLFESCFEQFFRLSSTSPSELIDPQGTDSDNEHAQQREKKELHPNATLAEGSSEQSGQDDQSREQMLADVMRAAEQVSLENIQFQTQRGVYRRRILDALAAGQGEESNNEGSGGSGSGTGESGDDGWIARPSEQLIELVKETIERQLLLNNNAANNALREDTIRDSNLAGLDSYYRQHLPKLIRKLAKKLASKHRQRYKRSNRGKPDLGKTLRRNIAYEGIPFHRYWKAKRRDKSEIFVLCDISGSVSAWSEILLLFLHALSDVLPNTRSFVFCGESVEVTELFREHEASEALAIIKQRYGMRSSDYGQALTSFQRHIDGAVNQRSCIIILGDGRSNGGNTGIDALRTLYKQARLLLWFNPESRNSWNTGDSEIQRYQSASHFVAECGSLRKLERLLDQLLTLIH
ncbi:MAG: VWA domain-containing protein [Spongiibacteraceae bacterium]